MRREAYVGFTGDVDAMFREDREGLGTAVKDAPGSAVDVAEDVAGRLLV